MREKNSEFESSMPVHICYEVVTNVIKAPIKLPAIILKGSIKEMCRDSSRGFIVRGVKKQIKEEINHMFRKK